MLALKHPNLMGGCQSPAKFLWYVSDRGLLVGPGAHTGTGAPK